MDTNVYLDLVIRLEGDIGPSEEIWTIWHPDGSGFPQYADLVPHFYRFFNRLGRDGWELTQCIKLPPDYRTEYRLAHLRKMNASVQSRWCYLTVILWKRDEQWVLAYLNNWAVTTRFVWAEIYFRLAGHGWEVLDEPQWTTYAENSCELIFKRRCNVDKVR